MPAFILVIVAVIPIFLCSRGDTALQVLANRQQVAVLKRPPGLPLSSFDRLFWTTPCRIWAAWTDLLVIVEPETAVDPNTVWYDCTSPVLQQ